MSARGRAARRARAGFTMVEVMVAVAIFAIGILGVVYLQSASVRSNQDAFESMVATNFARTWLERIKRDSVAWTAPGLPSAGLNAMLAGRPGAANSYFVPGAGLPPGAGDSGLRPMAGEAVGANYHGVEVGLPDPLMGNAIVRQADIYYCAFAWFTTVAAQGVNTSELRADVAVWWTRKASLEVTSYADIGVARQNGCQSVNAAQLRQQSRPPFAAGAVPRVRLVELSTVLRWVAP